MLVGDLACAETTVYLHGRIIEAEGIQPVQERFGLYDYLGIVEALQSNSATVIADVRSGNTNVVDYAHDVVAQIEALIESGESANNITVVGFSKGGAIAIYVSSLLNRPDVKFVFLAACGEWISSRPELIVSGNIFSIYEESDTIGGSCKELVQRNNEVGSFRELELSTGKGHGAFYLPRAVWVDPLLAWIEEDRE